MQCPQCQHDNREQARFCEGCGMRLVARYSECGMELGPGARFCSECGTPVAGLAPTLYRKLDRDEQAQVELATAAEMYRAMEMTFWLARAEAELGQMRAAR
jgi:hypothetical protein